MLAMLLSFNGIARAQALQQLPADPFVVIKFNNLEQLNQKVSALTQKLGLANIDPSFADPLGALRQSLNLNEAFNAKGDMAIAFYEPPQGTDEPRVVALVPVTDYKAFVEGLPDGKAEEAIATFTLPDDDDQMFATNWGSYAAIADQAAKDLLAQKPAGVEVIGAAAQKQVDAQDVIVFVNMPVIKTRFAKDWQQAREQAVAQTEQELQNDPNVPKAFAPAMKAVVGQLFGFVDQLINDGQAATFGVTVSEKGINLTGLAEFTPDSNLGQTIASFKNTEEPLVTGLPNRKYFSYGGLVSDPAAASKFVESIVGPVRQELEGAGEQGKPFLDLVDSVRTMAGAVEQMSFGYAAPQGNPGQEPVIQQVFVTTGKAEEIAAAQKQQYQAMANMFALAPEAQGKVNFNVQPAAKTVDGVALDQITMELKLDPNSPEDAQAQQMIQMMYGGQGMTGFTGTVDPQTNLTVFGAEALVNDAVAAAKAKENALTQGANVQAVAAELPRSRVLVNYIAVDNIISTGLQYAAQFGFPVNVKLPPDMPPVGITLATEGSAARLDVHISSDLIQQIISTGMQTMMMMQGGGGGAPGGGQL
jgi:hypothetical protein